MNTPARILMVDDSRQFTLIELSRICPAEIAQLVELVEEGVLTPCDDHHEPWRFAGAALPRARKALRLCRDLRMNTAGTALVLDLLDEIDALRLIGQR